MAHPGHDFVAQTKGSCFLCSNNITSRSRTTATNLSESCTIYSLDCLSRYLKIDMKKVFTGSGPIPPHLVARVEQSRLKTELCEKCILLNRTFSKLYQQWEKTEMEMTVCLNLFQENLERAMKPESKAQYLNDLNYNTKDEWMAKLEIIEALRKDTLLKCSRKLGAVRPSTKLRRLTVKQVNEEKRKLESRKLNYHEPNQYFESNDEDDNDDEDFGSPPSFSNEDGNDYHRSAQSPSPTPTPDVTEIKREITTEATSVPYELDVDIKMETLRRTNDDTTKLQQIYQATTTLKRKVNNREQLSEAIPPPLKVESGVGIAANPSISKNPNTGNYHCPICPNKYNTRTNCMRHYKSAHLKVRYKCTICKKELPFKQVYENHYLSIHMGVRFKCGQCDKSFSWKGHLMQHQKNSH